MKAFDETATLIGYYAYYADGNRRIAHGHRYYFDGLGGAPTPPNQEIAEYDSAWPLNTGTLERRYVRLPGSVDAPLLMIDYTGTCGASGCEHWVHSDARGSIVATSDETGAKRDIYTYNEYGAPDQTTGLAHRYTGQRYDTG